MGFIKNFQNRQQATRVGKAILGEGMGFKAPGSGNTGMLSELARMLQPQWSEAPQREISEWLDLYATSPRLDPIHKIAEDVSSAEWGLYKKLGDGEKERIDEHPLIDMMLKPNPLPESSWFSLLYMTEVYMYIAGEAFWVIERSGLNQISEMWIIPPDWVASTPSLGKDYYEVQTLEGQRMKIDTVDMIYFKEPNLKSPYGRGRGRATAIGDEVETDEYMAKWSKNFFFNDAKPPFVITAPGASKTDADRMQESWMQRFAGIKNAHKPAVLPFDGKIQELGKSQRDMDFVESRKFLRDQANQHFRVPPELMGIIENSNRATIDAADYIYRSSVLVNRLRRIEMTIQSQLVDRFFESENIVFLFEDVIPSDKEFELKQANDGLLNGAITVDEWRQKNGQDPVPGDAGNVFLVPTSHTVVANHMDANVAPPEGDGPKPKVNTPLEEPEDGEEDDPEDGNEEKRYQKTRKGVKALTWKDGYTAQQLVDISADIASRSEEVEKAFAKTINRFLKSQGKRFAKYIEGTDIKAVYQLVETKEDKAPSNDEISNAEDDADDIMDGFDWLDEQKRLHTGMGPSMMLAAQQGYEFANETFELGVSFNLIRDEMLSHINEAGFEKVVGITGSTISKLKKEVVAGILAGEGSAELAKRIRQASDEYSYKRSFVIARTESHSTMVTGSYMTYEQGGAESKQWLTIIDGRQRHTHSTLDGEIQPFDKPFSNNLMYPGDPKGSANEVIQCRCALLPA